MKNSKEILLLGARAAFFGAVALGAASVMAWTAAPANPPANNVAAPLNTSATAQSKAGKLTTTNAGYYVDLSRGDSWSFVSNGNVYASDVYSYAAGKWLSDAGSRLLGVVAAPYVSPSFTATVPAGATYAIVSIDGTVHGGGGDQSVASGKIYIDLVAQKSTGTYAYTTDCTVSAWTAVSFGTALTVCGSTVFGRPSQTNKVSLSGSTLTITLPSEKGAAFFQFYQ